MKRDATGKFVRNWSSETKKRFSISLTHTAWRSLDQEACKRGISRSEVVEQFARSLDVGQLPVTHEEVATTQVDTLQERILEQHRTIEALQRQKQDLEALLENAPDAIARFDSQIRYLYVNRVAEQVVGCSREHLLGKSMSELMSDPIYLFWEKHLREVLETCQEQEIEFELETPLGLRFYQARLVPELGPEGKPRSVVVISRDTTEAKQAQQQGTQLIATREAEQKVMAILESITDAFVAFDRDWHYTYVNQAAAQILGKTPEELIGKQVWQEVFPNVVGKLPYRKLHQAMAEQVPVSWEELGQPTQRWLEVNAYPSTEGVAVYFRDVTRRKQAEAERERLLHELEIERARFEAVLRQMPAGVLIADAESNKLVLANEQAQHIVEYEFAQSLKLQEYAPVTPFQAFHADGRRYAPEEYPLMRSLKRGEIITNEEMNLRRADGSHTTISVNSGPIVDKQGQILAAVVVFQDIAERKQAEALLKQQTEALENQQKWLESVLDLMPTPMVFIEPETAIVTFSNRIANELAGGSLPKHKSLEEYLDAYYCTDANGDRIPTEQMPAVLLAQGHRLENYEMNWHTPDGVRSTLCWGEMLPAMYGRPAISIGMFQDVTRLKQIEENLRRTEERLQLALSSAHIIAWDMNLNTQQVVCSANAQEIWGTQAGPAEDFEAVIHPDDQQQVRQAAEQAIAGEKLYWQEYRVIAPDGSLRWLKSQGRAYRDETGRGIRLIGVSLDITERKQIEAERDRLFEQEQAARRLAETERKRLYDILMQVPAMIGIVSGPEHRVEFANSTYLQLKGRSPDIIGKPLRDIFPDQEGQLDCELLDRVYQTGESCARNEVLVYGDHNRDAALEETFFNFVFPALRDAEGTVQGVLICGIEVTAQVQARRQIEQLLRELREKERQQQFLIELNDAIRAIQDPKEIMWQVASATGQHFDVSRCTYGEIDATQQYVTVDRDYCNGVISIVGKHHMNDFGPRLIAELRQGKTVVVNDVDGDPRTAGIGAAAFDAIQTKSLLCVPLVKAGRFVALLVLHHMAPRPWSGEDVAVMERIAQKTWLAVERSRAEAELRESEAHLQLALQVGRMGTWDWDTQMNTVAWSDGHYAIVGLQPRECEPSYELWRKTIHPDDVVVTEAALKRAMCQHTEFHHEYRILWKDGSLHWAEARGRFIYNLQDQPVRMIGVLIDITDRKQAEHERERLANAQRFLSEASAILASSLDYQTTLHRVAQLAVPELADWCIIHMIEEGAINQIAVAHGDPEKLEWAEQIRHQYPLNLDDPRGAAFTLRTGQSDFIPYIPDELLVDVARDPEHLEVLRQVGFRSVMTVPLRTQERILGVMSFVSAESERQYTLTDLQLAEELAHRASLAIDNAQLYQAAQRDRAKAQAANRVKDEFLAVLSHELRSPLNPILGWARLLRSNRLDTTKAEQALEVIERNARLQAQLIEDLLDVSRILQGKMSLNVIPVNLGTTIEAALETVRLAAEAKKIQLRTVINPIGGIVAGDPNRLQQVIWNLLSNAVKFTPVGGRIEIRLDQVGTDAQIQVRDTGKGISPAFLPYVFEYFRQEDGTTTRQFGGLGLGLALVRHFTELHGGTVRAESPGPDLGATFSVQLPLNTIEPTLLPEKRLSHTTDLTGIRILVVDDDADMRELASFVLEQTGAEVTTVASGAQALSFLSQTIPDLLLCDIGMPEMDGYALMRQIRKWAPEQGGNIPAIALTAYAGETNQQQALAAGFQRHIAKPVDQEVLLQAIASLVFENDIQ